MDSKTILAILIFSLFIIAACSQTSIIPVKDMTPEPVGVDIVGRVIKEIVVEEVIEEVIEEVPEEGGTSPEVKELLSLADKRAESLSYSYKGPETENSYGFLVKGDKIKYTIYPTFKDTHLDDDAYNTIYINKKFETALAYCDARNCRVKGKKAALDYDENYILTPFDWLDDIESPVKIGERSIDRRNTWKLSTNGFTIWIDTLFGVPLRVESNGNIYQFQKMSFNGVKDEDVSVKG